MGDPLKPDKPGSHAALQNPHLLDNACEIRDRLFVDGRRLGLEQLPDLRQVAAGQDREETKCHSGVLFALWTNAIGRRETKGPTKKR
jgi:hypothetical protein